MNKQENADVKICFVLVLFFLRCLYIYLEVYHSLKNSFLNVSLATYIEIFAAVK